MMETIFVIAMVIVVGSALAGTIDSIQNYYYNKYRNE